MSVFAPGTMRVTGSSAYGLADNQWSAANFMFGERCRQIDYWESIYKGTSHNWKAADFDGNWVGQGSGSSLAFSNAYRPYLGQNKTPFHVPLRQRRPTDPYRVGRLIVNSFTAIILEGGFPEILAFGDPDSEAFVQALSQAQRMHTRLILARTLGGSCGTVGMSWGFKHGRPFCRVHNAKHLYVHEWEDRDQLIPRHVTEVYRFTEPVFDERERKVIDKWFWHRRDWTDVADIPFKVVPYEDGKEPEWEIDEENISWHDTEAKDQIEPEHRECHFVWIQNIPTNDSPDGLPDYDGLEDSMEMLDVLNSLISRSLGLNLDPTLVLNMDIAEWAANQSVKKGSDSAIITGKGGSATYLELAGTSVQVGIARLQESTKQVLNSAQCILADPNEVAAQGMSAVALRTIYRPMTSKASVIREQYGLGLTRLFEQQLRYCQRLVDAAKKVTAAQMPTSLAEGLEGQPSPQMGGEDAESTQQMSALEALLAREKGPSPDDVLKEAMRRINAGEDVEDVTAEDPEDMPPSAEDPEADQDPVPAVGDPDAQEDMPPEDEEDPAAAGAGADMGAEDDAGNELEGGAGAEPTEADMILADREAKADEARVVVTVVFDLPPRVMQEPSSKGEPVAVARDHVPGEARFLEVKWPEFFPDTPDDLAGKLQTLSTATGGKPVVSQRTAVEKAAKSLGIDPDAEWQRVDNEQKQMAQQQAQMGMGGPGGGMFPGMEDMAGGQMPPPGAPGEGPPSPEDEEKDWQSRDEDWME
jgi:hypothetical protein